MGLNCHQTLSMLCLQDAKSKTKKKTFFFLFFYFLFLGRLPLLPETNIGRNFGP